MQTKQYIATFCSAVELDHRYVAPAKTFASLMARRGYHLVWGGSSTGLMKVMAESVQTEGGEIIGVSLSLFNDVEHPTATEMLVAETLGERKSKMLLRADAIAVLVGGLGTLDELTEVIELKKLGYHDKPIVVVNTNDFYTPLKQFMEKMEMEGLLRKPLHELVYFAATAEDALTYLDSELRKK